MVIPIDQNAPPTKGHIELELNGIQFMRPWHMKPFRGRVLSLEMAVEKAVLLHSQVSSPVFEEQSQYNFIKQIYEWIMQPS